MDRRVKERLVGASILVVLIVLIVPALLSGPVPPSPGALKLPAGRPEPVRNITVDMATSKASPAETEETAASAAPNGAASLPEARTETAIEAADNVPDSPAASAVLPAAEPSRPRGAKAAPAGKAAAPAGKAAAPAGKAGVPAAKAGMPAAKAAAPAFKAASSGGAWAVQLGSFASRENAAKLVRQLKTQGFPGYLVGGGSGASSLYRVRVGPLADHAAAAQAIVKLKTAGHPASLVPPAP